jgi:hypothetical protein
VGPVAAYTEAIAQAGWLLTFLALPFAGIAVKHMEKPGDRDWPWGVLGCFLAFFNVFGSCALFGGIFGD